MIQYYEFYHAVGEQLGGSDGLTQKQSSTLKFYMREYLHLPYQFIAEVLAVKRHHLVRDINRMRARADRVNIPVAMQNRYIEPMSQLDDIAREMGLKPRALSNLSPWKSQELLWQKAIELGLGHMYDGESEVSTDIEDLVYKIRKFADEADAVAYIKRNYTVSNA